MGVMSSTARVLSPTAVALGAASVSEDAEGAYVPLKAFYEAGSDAAKAFYKKAKKAIQDGMGEDELYQKHGVYISEDGDYKVDLPEIRARDAEYANAVTKFTDKAVELMNMKKAGVKRAGTMKDFLPPDSPVFENFPDLKDTVVEIKTSSELGLLGSYQPGDKKITVYVPHSKATLAPSTLEEKLTRSWRAFGTLVHEFQHNIQDVKGSKNTGSNSVYGYANIKKLQDDLADARQGVRDIDEMVNQGTHTNDDLIKRASLIEQQMYLEEMLQDSDVSHAIYIRELGEAEARSSGMKASLPHDERVQLGVFYPKHQRPMKYDKEGVESSIVSGDLPLLDKEEVLVRVETPKRSWDTEEYVLNTSDKAKKGKGFTDLPSSAFATMLGLDTTRRVLTDGLGEEETAQLDDYVQGRTGFKASDMSYAESDLVTEMPIVGDVLFAADIMSEIGQANPLEGDQPEAIDEFTGVEFASGGLMDNVPHMRQGGGVETPAGREMEKNNPYEGMRKDKTAEMGSLQQEAYKRQQIVSAMNCGGLMADEEAAMGIVIGIEPESGNEIPAGSTAKEVMDDVPAMLSEGEYVVPADVVRWHGVKHLEMMRQEAKMGLGLMAEDGRVSNHESGETKAEEAAEEAEEKDPSYYPEEDVEVVKAAEGSLIGSIMGDIYGRTSKEAEEDATDAEAPQKVFYRWSVILDPITKRYRYVPVLQETIEEEVVNEDGSTSTVKKTVAKVVTPEEFNPEQATRYSVDEQLKEVYQEFGEEGEDEAPISDAADIEAAGCPSGFTFSAAIGACMADVSDSGELIEPSYDVQYADQMTTKIAEWLGPLSEDQLSDYAGNNLGDKAISRMFEPTDVDPIDPTSLLAPGGILGAIATSVGRGIDAIGAKRAALTRANYLQESLSMDKSPMGLLDNPQLAYNFSYNTETASFVPVSPSTVINKVGYSDSAKSKDNPLGLTVTGYSEISNVYGQDGQKTGSYVVNDLADIWDNDKAMDDLLDSIDAQFDTLNTVVADGRLGDGEDFQTAAEKAAKVGEDVRLAEQERLAEEARIKAEEERKALEAAEKARKAEEARIAAEKKAAEVAAAKKAAALKAAKTAAQATKAASAYETSGNWSTNDSGTSVYTSSWDANNKSSWDTSGGGTNADGSYDISSWYSNRGGLASPKPEDEESK